MGSIEDERFMIYNGLITLSFFSGLFIGIFSCFFLLLSSLGLGYESGSMFDPRAGGLGTHPINFVSIAL